MYADKITASMQNNWRNRLRRTKQINFNTANNQVPQALNKKIESAYQESFGGLWIRLTLDTAAESETEYLSKAEIEKRIREKRSNGESR
jgi:excinuclease ABC subunit B